MVTLGHELAAADEKKADELNQRMGELEKKLGPEYAALMDGFPAHAAPIIHAVCASSQAVGGNLGQAAG